MLTLENPLEKNVEPLSLDLVISQLTEMLQSITN